MVSFYVPLLIEEILYKNPASSGDKTTNLNWLAGFLTHQQYVSFGECILLLNHDEEIDAKAIREDESQVSWRDMLVSYVYTNTCTVL